MKQQELNTFLKDVRVILEENVSTTPLEGVTDVGSISINQVIKGVIAKAVTAIAKIAPAELFSSPMSASFPVVNETAVVNMSAIATPLSACTVNIPYVYKGAGTIAITADSGLGATITSYSSYSVVDFAVAGSDVTGELHVTENGTEIYTIDVERASAQTSVQVTGDNPPVAYRFSKILGGYFVKPADYLRTLFVQGDDWERPVTELTPLSSPYVGIARSEVNLSVGNTEKPLVVDSFRGGHGTLEVYPATDTHYVDFVYIERPEVTKDTTTNKEYINCDDGIYHASVFYAAYLVANIKNYSNAETYKTAALDAINVDRKPTNATAGAEIQ